MPDFQSIPPSAAETPPNAYPSGDHPATPALIPILRQKIAAQGPISFPDFMEIALYHPEFGYYAKSTRQVGRSGDFFTSVSVGPLFGRLLARRLLKWWHQSGTPDPWRIIEIGAHDGTLAADVLREIRQLDPTGFSALEYVISEPLPLLQSAQRETLRDFENTRIVESTGDLTPLPGIAFGNEILDALPFHVIEQVGGEWRECRVDHVDDRFDWVLGEIFPNGPAGDFPEGYRTEVRTSFTAFFKPLLRSLSYGLLIWPDYGYAHEDYYHPDRVTGTLRTFAGHQAGENPLEFPGTADITAHVDFTAAADAASALGCVPHPTRTQSSWLTEIARDLLLSMEGRPDVSLLRQFQTLTHPAQLGSRFHVLEISWNP
jgi:SAM-dependent MidA family methyltransferase